MEGAWEWGPPGIRGIRGEEGATGRVDMVTGGSSRGRIMSYSPTASLTPEDPGSPIGFRGPRLPGSPSKCLSPSGPKSSKASTAVRVKPKMLTMPHKIKPHHFSNLIPPAPSTPALAARLFLKDSWALPTPGPLHSPFPQPGTLTQICQDCHLLSSQRSPPLRGLQ